MIFDTTEQERYRERLQQMATKPLTSFLWTFYADAVRPPRLRRYGPDCLWKCMIAQEVLMSRIGVAAFETVYDMFQEHANKLETTFH